MIAGVIGYRNHSKKIINLLCLNKDIKKVIIYLHKKIDIKKFLYLKKKKITLTYNLQDLDLGHCVFITSPTNTHFKYLKIFDKSKKYIFCEKPAASSYQEYKYLKNYSSKKKSMTYINYNLLFNEIFLNLKKIISNKKFGKLVNIDIKLTNGISYKKSLKNNWRFTSKNIFEKISGNLGSHYINFFFHLFNQCNIEIFDNFNVNKKKDACLIFVKNEGRSMATIFLSYSTIFYDEINIFMTNALIKIFNNKITLFYPRNTLNKKGLFVMPSKKNVLKINQHNSYDHSLKNSVNFFIEKCKNKKKIPTVFFTKAIQTIKFLNESK
tara:strand:- start:5492 stop:6463 length:972 start_codon:yes stop_codon:yes gene_type:complete